jgi:4-hydroxybenzoate polyprenyltransferase
LLIPLPGLALFFSLIYLALGQGYNLGLKSTPLSGVVFALAIPIIPVYAFVGVGHFTPILFWILPVGALLGVALNLANSLPDIKSDAINQARTLAVVLGVRGSVVLCPLLILLAAALIWILALIQPMTTRMTILSVTLAVTVLLVGGILYLSGYGFSHTDDRGLMHLYKIYFFCVVCACLLLAGGWLISML